MNNKEILHKILLGMDSYISCGVPAIYWKLARKLTLEIYGAKGVKLLESAHDTFEDASTLHSIQGWETPNIEITPKWLIKKLEEL